MITKWLKLSVIIVVSVCIIGGLLFGTDMLSYMKSSAKSVQSAVKDSVPIEFELKRAHDLLDEIIPEIHANIRLIAQEEVEVAALNADIEQSQKVIEEERRRVKKLRQALETNLQEYKFGNRKYSRDQLKATLAEHFERFKETEMVLASKERLLIARQGSLQGAMQLLERTRSQKRLLEEKVSGLESQFRLVKASAVGSRIHLDGSKLAQTEKLINNIKKRLDVAERILEHESKIVATIPIDSIEEKDLLGQIDEYFAPSGNLN